VSRVFFLFGLIIVFTIADLLFIRYYGHDLGYGGDNGFLRSVFNSVWSGSLYFMLSNGWSTILSYASFGLIILTSVFYYIKFIQYRNLSFGLVISIPVAMFILFSLFFHASYKIPYLYGRTALQWWIPAMFLICYGFSDWVSSIKSLRIVTYSVSGILCVLITFHFSMVFNSKLCFEWYYQANNRQAIIDLYELHPVHPKINPVLRGVYYNYYAVTTTPYILKNVDVLKESETTVCDDAFRQSLKGSDYILTYFPGTIDCLEEAHIKFHVIKTYSLSQNKLIKIDQ
jgi:hypothetical protein